MPAPKQKKKEIAANRIKMIKLYFQNFKHVENKAALILWVMQHFGVSKKTAARYAGVVIDSVVDTF